MASKKQSEGIALLSLYNDDGDDEMEDIEDEDDEEDEDVMRGEYQDDAAGHAAEEDLAADTDRTTVADSGNEVVGDGFTPTEKSRTPHVNRLFSPPQEQQRVELRISRSATLTIVDYGHDEVAMSPEPEEGEIDGSGRVMFGDQLHVTNGDLLDRTSSGTVQVLTPNNQANTPQFSEALQSDTLNYDAVIRPDDAELEEADQDEHKSVDPLDKFLPPPPKAKCSEELQRKINKFLEYKKAGKSFNAEVRNRKDYRNPDFLLHAVRYQDIDQIGSCFSKDVFDPHGYDSSDFYDQIEADMRRESDKKEQEKKKAQNPKVEFASGGTQPGIVLGAPRISMPVTGGSAATTGGMQLVLPAADSINRDGGRQNKKSKWDKVDGDRKNPLPSVGQDSVSTAGAHAAILSAANAGSGYMLFAQQKRREAEEKRSSERRLERRS